MPLAVRISDELAPHVTLGVVTFGDLRVVSNVRRPPPGSPPDGPGISDRTAMVRAMYRRIGIDPTKTRPSSEALLRRVRRGQPWPTINSLVDTCNECSLFTQLPYGLYDADRIEGDVVLRKGQRGDEYVGIRKPVVHLEGRPALFDDVGPFGNPTSDSARTMVTTTTTHALVVIYAPKDLERSVLMDVLDLTASRVRETTEGVERARSVVESTPNLGLRNSTPMPKAQSPEPGA